MSHLWPELRHPRELDLPSQQRLAGAIAPLLIFNFFLFYMIGDHPFTSSSIDKAVAAASGSMLNRLLIFGTFAVSILLMLPRAGAALRLLLSAWIGAAIVAWSFSSFLWASHPDLTIRRGIAYAAVYLALVFLVAVTRSSVNVFRALAVALALVCLLNIFVMVTMPDVSRSPIGERGIFDSKNTAGTVGLLTVMLLAVSVFLSRQLWLKVVLGLIYLLAWLFLIRTESKTSTGVAVLMTGAAPLFYVLFGHGSTWRVLALIAAVAALFCGMVAAGLAGANSDSVTLLLFGDLTFSMRTPIWNDVVKTIADQPWLGYGFGSFWDVGAIFNPLRYAPWDAFYADAQVINTSHNGYLDQLLQTGIVGLGLGLAAIFRCLYALQTAAVRTQDRLERIALVGFFCLALSLALNNLLESYLFRTGDGFGYLFFVLMLQAEQACLSIGSAAKAGR